MKQAWNCAVMTTVATVALGVTAGCATTSVDPVQFIKYESYQDPSFDPAYSIAWDAMAALYKGSEYEKGKPDTVNPYMSLGQVDLNGDRVAEILAAPEPAYPESVQLCTPINQLCPYYILEVRGKKVHNLGILTAATIDRGDNLVNGYWTLNVYGRTKSGDEYTGPIVYIYDPKKDGYVPQTSSGAPRPATP